MADRKIVLRDLGGGANVRLYEDMASHYGSDAKLIEKHWPVKPGDVCLDIGCGPGTWTLSALARGAAVFAFDPRPLAVSMLSESLSLNPFTDAFILPCGVWEETGAVPFEGSAFKGSEPGERFAAVISLDDFDRLIRLMRLDYIAMDVEGSEVEVVRGGRSVITRFVPDLFIEIHDENYRRTIKDDLASMGGYAFEDDGKYLAARVGIR